MIAQPGLWSAHVDAARLRAAVRELIGNAREAMSDRGRLTVEIANLRASRDSEGRRGDLPPGDYVRLSLRDTGEGLTPELAERVMNPFFSAGSRPGRLGLGLSMAYGFTSQSGGRMDIAPADGGGAVVELYLPRARRAAGIEIDGTTRAGTSE